MTIGDNLSAVLSFEKGRPQDGALGNVVARAAAYQIGCRIAWRQRFTFSEHNATDYDSRAADRREVSAGQRVVGDRRSVDRLLGAPRAAPPAAPTLGEAKGPDASSVRPIAKRATYFCEVLGDGRLSSSVEVWGGVVAPEVSSRQSPSERCHRARQLFRAIGQGSVWHVHIGRDTHRTRAHRRLSLRVLSACLLHNVTWSIDESLRADRRSGRPTGSHLRGSASSGSRRCSSRDRAPSSMPWRRYDRAGHPLPTGALASPFSAARRAMAGPRKSPTPRGATLSSTRTSSTPSTSPSSASRLTYDSSGTLTLTDCATAPTPCPRPPAMMPKPRRKGAATRHGRAVARAARAAAGVKISSVSYLKLRSVTALTAQRYAAGARRLQQFATSRYLPLDTAEQRDEVFEQLFDRMYFAGAQSHEARYILFGAAFMLNFSASPHLYPRAHRALRGCNRAAPGGTHAAMPWEAALILALTLALEGPHHSVVADIALPAARAVLLQFDTYLRPNYVLELTRSDCILPQGHASAVITVMIRKSDDVPEGSAADVRLALAGVERRRQGKTGDLTTPCASARTPARRRAEVSSSRCCEVSWPRRHTNRRVCSDSSPSRVTRGPCPGPRSEPG